MSKIMIVSKNENEGILLQKKLASLKREFTGISFSTARPMNASESLPPGLSVIVYNALELNTIVQNFIASCRNANFLGPIVIITKGSNKVYQFEEKNVVFVEKPYNNIELIGVVKNCLESDKAFQRKFRRFAVRQNATVETYNSGFKADTVIKDISQGGVGIVGNLTGLEQGDFLRIHFDLDELKKERVMSARVAWIKEGEEDQEAGLEFVSQEVIYKYLLNYALA